MSNKNVRLKIVSLIMIFVFPLVAGGLLYHYHDRFNLKTVNHGVLINPPVQTLGWLTDEKSKGKWQIIYMPDKCSTGDAYQQMHTLHQIQKALGKEGSRVSLVLLGNAQCNPDVLEGFQKQEINAEQNTRFKNLFPSTEVVVNKIYLVDPAGNLFMYYDQTIDPMNILKDLKRVLEVSQIG